MKSPEPSTPPAPGPNYGEMLIAFMALPPELLLHDPRTFGVRSVAARGAGAVLAMYLFGLFFTQDDRNPLLILTLVTAVLAVIAHVFARLRQSNGTVLHSFYNGRPWLAMFLPISQGTAKLIEPLLIVAAGWWLHYWNDPLGAFLITGGACYGLRTLFAYLANRVHTLDFNDALAEQSVAMQLMKQKRRRQQARGIRPQL